MLLNLFLLLIKKKYIPIDTKNRFLNDFLNYKINTLPGNFILMYNLFFAFILFILVWLSIRLVKSKLFYKRLKSDPEYGSLVAKFMIYKYAAYIFLFFGISHFLGVDVKNIWIGSAALLVGVGLGLQKIFSDITSGLFMLFERPIEVSDVIEVDNNIGKVVRINLRHTIIEDNNGVNLIIPNSKFVSEKVVNWSFKKEDRRFTIKVNVVLNTDVNKVKEILTEAAQKHDMIINDIPKKQVEVLLTQFANKSLEFDLNFWTIHGFKIEKIKSEIRTFILEEFNKHEIKLFE
ncbi:MAG: mechanosensitive ion channel [Chitinophagaceae bacterium]|nr:mechanosensitive ion channel [Chitinophagaceae bacterium]